MQKVSTQKMAFYRKNKSDQQKGENGSFFEFCLRLSLLELLWICTVSAFV